MIKSRLLGAVCACLLSITVTSVNASVIYEYTGNDFTHDYNLAGPPIGYNSTGALSLSIELSTPLGLNETRSSGDGTLDLLGFSYSDGAGSRGSASSFSIYLRSNNAGGIGIWDIIFTYPEYALEGDESGYWRSRSFVTEGDATWTTLCTNDNGSWCTQNEVIRSGSNVDSPGVWSVASSVVPLPPAFWLFGSGLLGLIGIARRKKA